MGSEIAVLVLGPIVLIVAIVLVVVAIRGRNRVVTGASTLGLGRSRIALGYLGALAASVPVAVWMARDDAQFQVASHAISAETAAQHQSSWSLTFYFILAPIAIFLITVAGLPILALLRKIRLVSVVGTLGAGLILSVMLSYWMDTVSPENIGIFETIVGGFALAARLPWIRSPKPTVTKVFDGTSNAG